MFRALCVLGLMSLYVGLAHSWSGSWDFAAVSSWQLDFFVGRKIMHTKMICTSHIDKSTYDVVHNRLFFSSSDQVHDLILSCDIATNEIESVVTRSEPQVYITDMAFDPVQELLFWTGSDNNIYSYSLKLGCKKRYGKVIVSMGIMKPLGIAVDSCKGFIYWTNTDMGVMRLSSTIERARFDGSEREVVIGSNLQIPRNLVIDPQTQKLYWTDGTSSSPSEDSHFSIECADLNGHNRITLYNESNGEEQPSSFVVSKDSIYLGHSYTKIVKQIPKYPTIDANPELIQVKLSTEIFTNYKIEDQFKGIKECETQKSVLTNESVTNNVCLNVTSDKSLFCVHGMITSGDTRCKCALGYSGERCEVSVCHNYCFNGDCSVNAGGPPTCRCNGGYSGERCEVDKCQGYCLNNGVCSLNTRSEPVCQCKGDYEGERCEVTVCLNKCFQKLASIMWGPRNAESNTWRVGPQYPPTSRSKNWHPSAAWHS